MLGQWLMGRGPDDPYNGDLYLALPDNAVKDLNMHVWDAKHYGAWASVAWHELVHETLHPALTDPNLERLQLGVGEYVNCGFEPGNFPAEAQWSTTSGGFDTTVGNWVWYTAPSNAGNATVTVDVAGTAKFRIKFKVKEPTGVVRADIISTNHVPVGWTGAGMHLRPFVGPLDVSFYRVTIMEVGENATSVSGWFTNVPVAELSHIGNGADTPIPIMQDNSWDPGWDWATEPGPGLPVGYGGGYTWNIPGRWWIGNSQTNNLTGWSQIISMDAAGSITIQKFERSVQRTTSDVITTN